MPLLQADQPPPPDYYASNVRQVLAQVLRLYGDILPAPLGSFLSTHAALSENAQRLYARLVMRKGPLFRVSKLDYPEIATLDGAISELEIAGLLATNKPAAADQLLGLANFAELKSWFPQLKLPRQTKRLDWVAQLMSSNSDQQVYCKLLPQMRWIALRAQHQLQASLLLYFGNRHQDFSSFITQDLGLFEYEQYPLTQAGRELASAADIASALRVRRLADLSHRLEDYQQLTGQGAALAQHLAKELSPQPYAVKINACETKR